MKRQQPAWYRAFCQKTALFSGAEPAGIDRPGRGAWAALGLLGLFCLLSYCYTDLPLIVRHSLNLWRVLGRGELFSFYQTATLLPVGEAMPQTGEVPYDIWVYLLLAVWNLPVFLWELVSGHTIETSLLALLWARLGLLLPYAGCFWALRGAAGTLGCQPRQAEWACFGFAGSLFLINGLFCVGQIDIFGAFFALMGFWAFVRQDTPKFIGWFALAVTFKMFALFAFLPLLLLAEKRPLRLAGHTLAACSLSLISKLLFFRDKMATPTQFDERRFFRFLLAGRLDTQQHLFSVTAVLFGALLLLCWLARPAPGAQPRWAVFALLAGYGCLFLGGTSYPYWAVVLAPGIGLLLLFLPSQANGVLLLELAASAGYWLHGLLAYSSIYSGIFSLRWTLTGRLLGARVIGDRLGEFWSLFSPGAQLNLQMLADSAFLLGFAGLLVLAWPGRAQKKPAGPVLTSRFLVWLRIAAAAALALLPVAVCLL